MLEDVLRSLVFYFTTVLQRRKRDGGISAIITAIASSVSAGTTIAIAATSFSSLNYGVKMKMTIG